MKKKKPTPSVISEKRIYELGFNLEGRDRIFYYFLYLTGARITEGLKLLVDDVSFDEWDKGFLKIDLFTNKVRKMRTTYLLIDENEYTRSMCEAFKNYYEGLFREQEYPLKVFEYFTNYEDDLERARKRILMRFHRKLVTTVRAESSGWYKGERIPQGSFFEFHIHPHYLRHCRATHMVQMYDLSLEALKQFGGWVNINTPYRVYIQPTGRDLKKALEKKIKVEM
ncbi:tyrosine-type recombinase/integrase [bacterium]|nr:tyrosine-type recombinase/integrase [bacterium]